VELHYLLASTDHPGSEVSELNEVSESNGVQNGYRFQLPVL